MLSSIVNSTNLMVQWLGGLVMVAGGIWAIIRWVHNIQTKVVEERLLEHIDKIKQSGAGEGSLREAIERIEKKLDILENDLVRHLGYHQGYEAKD
jgi:hypothetical protein